MRPCARWLVLGCVALSAGCGLSMGGSGGLLPEAELESGPPDGVDSATSAEGAAPGNDAATDAHHGGDATTHKPDASDAGADATAEEGGPGQDAASSDAVGEAPGSPDASDGGGTNDVDAACDGSAGCVTVPSGWTLVAFAPSQSAACPAGFQTPENLVETPNTTSACGCGTCSVTGQPSCASGAVDVFYDYVATGGGCATPGQVPQLNNSPAGACGSGTDVYHGNYSPFDIAYVPPPASGGTCAAPGSGTGSVTYAAHDRACVPVSAQAAGCVGSQCAPSLSAPYQACIMASGSASCPAGPLGVQHLAGSGVSFGCSACGCSVTATCTGTITLYADSKCTKQGVQIPADGSCNKVTSLPDGQNTYTFGAYIYAANAPASVGCSATGSSSAENVSLAGPVTICCAQ